MSRFSWIAAAVVAVVLGMSSASTVLAFGHHGRCCEPPPIEVALCVAPPCSCCPPQEVCVCVPCCCTEPPTVCWSNGLFGRQIGTYTWPCCGHEVKVVVTKRGDVKVRG